MLFKCIFCDKPNIKSGRGLFRHLQSQHDITDYLKYSIEYENFKIPICICGKECKWLHAKKFLSSCGDSICKSNTLAEKKVKIILTDESKSKMRNARLKFMKENPSKTAWRQRAERSWPEKFFQDGLIRAGLDKKFEIISEMPEFPFYIDFAFPQMKVAVEVDGSQHKLADRKLKDAEKDAVLMDKKWRVYRIPADKLYSKETTDEVIADLINFIGTKEIFKECGIKSSRQKKEELLALTLNKKNAEAQEKRAEILGQLEKLDYSRRGWTLFAAQIIGNCKPSSVRRWLYREMPEFYIKHCEHCEHGTRKISFRGLV